MTLSFDIVDVFTDRPFAGNQLAVVHGADVEEARRAVAEQVAALISTWD